MNDRLNLRTTFNNGAELYNSARPTYPQELFDALIQTTHLNANARLLEIGPGTGQATQPLAELGYRITAVELGSQLAEVARRELRLYPNVDVITGAFETVDLPSNTFDLVYSATAFHWIHPNAKFKKPYKLLKPNGYLAIIHTEHISDGANDAFLEASQPIYDKYLPNSSVGSFHQPNIADLKPLKIDNELFENISFKVFPVTNHYSAKQYSELLSTYSPQLAMSPSKRQAFMKDIANLINERLSGSIEQRLAMTLVVAKRK